LLSQLTWPLRGAIFISVVLSAQEVHFADNSFVAKRSKGVKTSQDIRGNEEDRVRHDQEG
jgi:hypothetical protein